MKTLLDRLGGPTLLCAIGLALFAIAAAFLTPAWPAAGREG